MKFNKMLRKLIPSSSQITYNPLFRFFADAIDVPARLTFREFRNLPPNHLRIRVGVANRIFTNQILSFTSSRMWMLAFSQGWCDLNSTIVDIGVGCGRYAHHLRDFILWGETFKGKYLGIDVDREALEWDRSHFDAERFTFVESTDINVSYNKTSDVKGGYRIPLEDGTADFVFSTSLFSHLLEDEARNYLKESARVLKSGKVAAHSVFCIDYPPPTYGDRHTFAHKIGNALVESLRVPEAAVAYTQAYLFEQAIAAGFVEPKIMRGPNDWQPLLVMRKP